MAIQEPLQSVVVKLLPETASRVISIKRTVIDNGDKTISVFEGATIHATLTTYEVDSNNNPTAIYDSVDFPSFDLADAQMVAIFGIQVTLADGTVSSIGEVISNATDQIIAAQFGLENCGEITTQHINLAGARRHDALSRSRRQIPLPWHHHGCRGARLWGTRGLQVLDQPFGQPGRG